MNANHKKIAIIIFSSATLYSCAGPETYQQKMSRYSPKTNELKNIVPSVQVSGYTFPTTSKGRNPASTSNAVAVEVDKKEVGTTNKKLYFLTLLGQYEALKEYSQNFSGPEINICPNFHTSLIKYHDSNSLKPKSNIYKSYSYDLSKLKDEKYLAKKPEFSLPLSKEEIFPKVIDIINSSSKITESNVNELVQKALDIHLTKTYSEIRELCEYGASDNYYAYENLITYVTNNKFEPDSANMNTLLKTTLFSNMVIIKSLEAQTAKPKLTGRSIASVNENRKSTQYDQEVISRLNVSWIKSYFDYIKN